MSQIENSSSSKYNTAHNAALAVCALAALVVVSFGLALIENQFSSIAGWTSYFWVSLISLGVLLGVWRSMEKEQPPRWLFYLVVAAALLRLAAGVFWSFSLPRWGHATPAEQGGYIMGDAAGRDLAAWKLAQSDSSLLSSFQNNRKVDQYGGLLFISALIYRYLGADFHQPWLVVLLGALFSGLAVLFVWAFTRRIWDDSAARIAAWAMFLYPEAVLLGSSQMREAFTIPLAAASFYGLARYRDDHSPTSLAWMLVPVLFAAFFSPLSAAMLLGGLALAGLFLIRFGSSKSVQRRWFWLILGLLLVVGLAGLWFVLREVVPARITNPIAMLSWWLRKSASFQAYLSEHASGWMQKIFDFTPDWTHLPMLIAYGVVQPFLPAALIAGSEAPIWRFVAVWRSLGWTLLLAFLVYAPFHAFRRKEGQNLISGVRAGGLGGYPGGSLSRWKRYVGQSSLPGDLCRDPGRIIRPDLGRNPTIPRSLAAARPAAGRRSSGLVFTMVPSALLFDRLACEQPLHHPCAGDQHRCAAHPGRLVSNDQTQETSQQLLNRVWSRKEFSLIEGFLRWPGTSASKIEAGIIIESGLQSNSKPGK